MIQIILLAAGLSRRFGENKLLASLGGRPLYSYALEALAETARRRTDCSLAVVTRYEAIRAACAVRGIPVLWNGASEEGIASSLRMGLLAAPEADWYLCSVADQPGLTWPLTDRFLTDSLASGKGLAAFSHQGEAGNPVLFSRRYQQELLALTGDQGGKQVLRRHREDCLLWEGPSLRDIDRQEDLINF